MKRVVVVIPMFLFLSACASDSGVVPTGSNSYLVTKQAATGFPGLGNLKTDAIKEASAYCDGKAMGLVITSTHETSPPFVLGNYPRAEVNFACGPKSP
jgi:hypothetical protein